MGAFNRFSRVLAAVSVLFAATQVFAAEDGAWSVSKSSGEVWITTAGVQQASLKADDNLKAGDTIRTGRNGRVLLVRGEETILIAPNSVIGLPVEKKDGLSTTITQQAGSILLEVEKKNVKHFEVETPYLAAVVKGTQFRVSVNGASTNVEVMRGQVEVVDFKSGQIAQVLPGQTATAFEHTAGLSLSGSGSFNPIEHGKPRASSVDRIPVPKTGLTAPRNAANGQTTRALAAIDRGSAAGRSGHVDGGPLKHAVTRISSALGEVKLNFHKITHGLARSATVTSGTGRSGARDTVWSSSSGSATASSSQTGSSTSDIAVSTASSTTGNSSGSSGTSSGTAVVAAVTNSGSSSGNGNGNGANGNGNGNGNDHGNSHANNGNGNGNGNVNGHNKH